MPFAKIVQNTNTEAVTGRKVVNAIRSLDDPEGSSVSEIRKCIASRLQLDRIPDQEELKVLLDEAVNRGNLTKNGRRYMVVEKEKNKKTAHNITKRRCSVKNVKSKLRKTRNLNEKKKAKVNSDYIFQPQLVSKRNKIFLQDSIRKLAEKEKNTRVAGQAKKRQRTQKSDTNKNLAKKRTKDAKKELDPNQMPESSVPKTEDEEKKKNIDAGKTKSKSSEKITAKSKLTKKRKLDANKADENSENINQASPISLKYIPKMAEEEKNKNVGEITKRQRAEKSQPRSKKNLPKKLSQNSKKSDANSEDTGQSQSIPARAVTTRGNFTPARLNGTQVDEAEM